mmetsp:Transcript_15527/g.31418  ORF Transcript_15527/g.31418 Transcript_15527/m.31418 type:complete len:141 (-) Transcript_15527:1049-1471(-)
MAPVQRLRQLFKQYGMVATGVHLSVGLSTLTAFYVILSRNVDAAGLLAKTPLARWSMSDHQREMLETSDLKTEQSETPASRKTSWLAGGSTLAVAILCNKATLPLRIPITIALTRPVHQFLVRQGWIRAKVSADALKGNP